MRTAQRLGRELGEIINGGLAQGPDEKKGRVGLVAGTVTVM
jgi:hypothetical protein